MPWILGSAAKDIGAFYLAPFALVGLAISAPEWLWWPVLGFLVYQWFDVGHAFPTLFRVAPRWGSTRLFTLAAPALIFVGLAAGFALDMRWTLVAVVYLTAFHHIRQFYGISRWYQYLNGRLDSWTGRWLYALTLWPLLLVHFRADVRSSQFAWAQLPHFEQPQAEFVLKMMLALFWAGWGISELVRLNNSGPELNRILSVFVPGLLHYWCFTQAPSVEAMLFPLLTMHALTYFFVVQQKMGDGRRKLWHLPAILIAALAGGTAVFALESYGETLAPGPWAIVFLSLALTPAIWHYIVDGFIWRKTDLVSNAVNGVD